MHFTRFVFTAFFSVLFASSCLAQSAAGGRGTISSLDERELAEPLVASARPVSDGSGQKTTAVITGQVMSPYGPLAGVYIKLLDYPISVVANAEGEFTITVPNASEKVRALVTYAGFPDETVLLPLHQAYLTVEPWEGNELKSMGVKFKNNRLKQGAALPN